MHVRQWLTDRGIDPDKVLALSVGTDGFVAHKHNVLSISATGSFPGSDIGTAFVHGADPAKVVHVTGVSPEMYNEFAMPIEEAEAKIKVAVDQASFLVIYSAKWTWNWLETHFPDLVQGKEYIDVLPLTKLLDTEAPLPSYPETVSKLQSAIKDSTEHIKTKGYGFADTCARLIPDIDGDTADAQLTGSTPELERKVYMLYALWQTLSRRDSH